MKKGIKSDTVSLQMLYTDSLEQETGKDVLWAQVSGGPNEIAGSLDKSKILINKDLLMCVYVYIWIYVCICVYVYVCEYLRVCIYVCVCECVNKCVYVQVPAEVRKECQTPGAGDTAVNWTLAHWKSSKLLFS